MLNTPTTVTDRHEYKITGWDWNDDEDKIVLTLSPVAPATGCELHLIYNMRIPADVKQLNEFLCALKLGKNMPLTQAVRETIGRVVFI